MKHAPARIAAASVSAAVFAIATATIPAFADANPNNEGHHYGQLKHPKQSPVPSPSPIPSPNPPTAVVPTPNPLTASSSTGGSVTPASQLPVAGLNPVPVSKGGSAQTAPKQPIPNDPLWLLVLLILPGLVATWLMAFKGLAARAWPRRRLAQSRPEPAVAELIPSPQA